MTVQWPLIISSALMLWAAGLFGAQCVYSLRAQSKGAQVPALAATVALVVGALAALLVHLKHWERFFSCFNNIHSSVTQGLIAVLLVAVLAVVFIVVRNQSEEDEVPSWLALVGVVVAVAAVALTARFYMMASRASAHTVPEVLCFLGQAAVLGAATMAVLAELVPDGGKVGGKAGLAILGCAGANAVLTAVYLGVFSAAAPQSKQISLYVGAGQSTTVKEVVTLFSGDYLVWTVLGVIVVGVVATLVAAALGKKTGAWKVWAPVCAACALIGALCVRFAVAGVTLAA